MRRDGHWIPLFLVAASTARRAAAEDWDVTDRGVLRVDGSAGWSSAFASWTLRRGIAAGAGLFAGRGSFGSSPTGSSCTISIGPSVTLYRLAMGGPATFVRA